MVAEMPAMFAPRPADVIFAISMAVLAAATSGGETPKAPQASANVAAETLMRGITRYPPVLRI
jgi:hypothetical protein